MAEPTAPTHYGAASLDAKLRAAGAPELTVVEFAVDDGPVGAGGSGSRYMTAADGTRWVVKAPIFGSQQHRYLALNEAVSAQTALAMGIPVPRPGVVPLTPEVCEHLAPGASLPVRFAFASELIVGSEPLGPTAASETDANVLAGIAVFDTLTWNTDRKPEHVLARCEDGRWSVWAIDHGHTLAVADTLTGALVPTQPCNPPMDLLAQHLTEERLEPWISKAQSLDRADFSAMVSGLPAEWVVEPEAAATIADALHARARELAALLQPHVLAG